MTQTELCSAKTNTPTPLPSFPIKVLSTPSWLVFRHEVCFPGCPLSTHSFATSLHFGVLGSPGRFIPPSHLHHRRKQRGGHCSQRQEARELLTETKAEEVTYFLWEMITRGLGGRSPCLLNCRRPDPGDNGYHLLTTHSVVGI